MTATVVAVTSSVLLARLFTLSDEIQRSLAVRLRPRRSAFGGGRTLGGQPDLVALFVVVTGVTFGMAGRRRAIFASLYPGRHAQQGDSARRHMGRKYRRVPMNLVSRRGRRRQSGHDAVRRGDGAGSPAGGEVMFLIFSDHGAGGNGKTRARPCCTPNPAWERIN